MYKPIILDRKRKWSEMTKQDKKRQRFEERELWLVRGRKGQRRLPRTRKELSDSISPTGYDAYRVSPRTTKKHGGTYRKIYGATVSPQNDRTKPGKVTWSFAGVTSTKFKGGTTVLMNLKNMPIDAKETASRLMLKGKRKTKSKRRK